MLSLFPPPPPGAVPEVPLSPPEFQHQGAHQGSPEFQPSAHQPLAQESLDFSTLRDALEDLQRSAAGVAAASGVIPWAPIEPRRQSNLAHAPMNFDADPSFSSSEWAKDTSRDTSRFDDASHVGHGTGHGSHAGHDANRRTKNRRAEEPDDEWHTHEGQQVYLGCCIPRGYELWLNGTFVAPDSVEMDEAHDSASPLSPARAGQLRPKQRLQAERVSRSRIWIERRARFLGTSELLYKLCFSDAYGKTQYSWVSSSAWSGIAGHKALLGLSAIGLDVSMLNVRKCITYLQALEWETRQRLPCKNVALRSGYYEFENAAVGSDGNEARGTSLSTSHGAENLSRGWLVGANWITLDGSEVSLDPRETPKHAQAYTSSGIEDAWLAKWREVRAASWVNRFLTSAMFAPPLMRYLNSRTFILHHYGESSSGKTASAQFGLSVWGKPSQLFSSLNRTAISATEVFKYIDELPVFFDEQQVSTLDTGQFIYAMCSGTGRERSTVNGGLQDRPTWRTIVRTTGEEPLVGSDDLGGQFNRVVQIKSAAFSDRAFASSLYSFSERHYGFAGPAFLKKLLDILARDGDSGIRTTYERLRKHLVEKAGVRANHCDYLAVVATAQVCADRWLLRAPLDVALKLATEDAERALAEVAPAQQETYSERALRSLKAHWFSFPDQYLDDSTPEGRDKKRRKTRIMGVKVPGGLAYISNQVDKFLKSEKFAPQRVWSDFMERGWIRATKASGRTELSLNGQMQDIYFLEGHVIGLTSERHLSLVQSAD